MLPIHFGKQDSALFGIFHPARQARAVPMSAVLCHPLGNEYVGAYRTMRVLAEQLADAGVSVLRFDYFGTGDSAGLDHEASVQRWLGDIHCAIEEIKGAAATEQTSLIGVRLGATLAATCARMRHDIDRVVLWDPVIRGAEHVAQHMTRHRDWLALDRCRKEDSSESEALGFPFSDLLIGELSALDLTAEVDGLIDNVLMLFHDEDSRRRGQELSGLGERVDLQVISSPDFWLGRTAFDQPLVSKSNIQSIVAWLTGVTG